MASIACRHTERTDLAGLDVLWLIPYYHMRETTRDTHVKSMCLLGNCTEQDLVTPSRCECTACLLL